MRRVRYASILCLMAIFSLLSGCNSGTSAEKPADEVEWRSFSLDKPISSPSSSH